MAHSCAEAAPPPRLVGRACRQHEFLRARARSEQTALPRSSRAFLGLAKALGGRRGRAGGSPDMERTRSRAPWYTCCPAWDSSLAGASFVCLTCMLGSELRTEGSPECD